MSTATLQGLQQIPCSESVNYYHPGGFHPVHLNDTFKDGRYQVVHKLGYGAYGTVWLVYDGVLKRYGSLKILSAEVSDSHSEAAVIQHLHQHARGSGKGYVAEVFDFFKHSGPNGTHQCIVMEVLGPPIISDTGMVYPYESLFPVKVAKRISAQVAHGLAYIHSAGIVHGDLHIANVLLYSPTIASWSRLSDFEKYLGAPARGLLRLWETNELAAPSPHIPSYVVCTAHPKLLMQLCLSDPTRVHVKICDFGEAFIPAMQVNPTPLNTPVLYAAPEIIFGDPTGQPADIWALAVLIHNVFSLIDLFPPPYYTFSQPYDTLRKEVIKQIVLTLGKLPERWWSNWEERSEWFNDDGEWTSPKRKRIVEWSEDKVVGDSDRNPKQKMIVSGGCQLYSAELRAFDEMIRRMVKYDPGERASIGEVIEWLNQNAWFVTEALLLQSL